MSLEREDIRRALLNKGFREDTKGRDHDFYFLYIGERKQSIYTKLSRGGQYRTYGDDLVRDVARQLKLTKTDLRELVSCLIDGVTYVQKLRAAAVPLHGD